MTPLLSGSSQASNWIRRLRTLQMKTAIPMLALVISTAAPTLLAADDETAQDHSAQYKQLEQQINDYYNVDSPWSVRCGETARAAFCADAQLEGTLRNLMAAEVLSWQLCENLKQRKDEENYSTASAIGSHLHEEVLDLASKGASALRKHPNQRLLKLLITHLETYPYSCSEEGYEDLLPNLKKLLHAKPK
jgi:hypothetical protein